MALKIIWNNIINEPADVIVTPASRKPRPGTGMDKVIHHVGGERLTTARKALGTIEPGVVKWTPSFGLSKAKCKAKYVIHALGPWCERGELDGTERPLLFGCYLQILCTAVALKAKTVSVPVMSSGKFGMPIKLAVDTAVEAIDLFLKAVPRLNVKLVSIKQDFYRYAAKKYPERTVSHYDEASEAVYRAKCAKSSGNEDSKSDETFADKEESEYFRTLRFRRETAGKSFTKILQNLWLAAKDRAREDWNSSTRSGRSKKKDGDYLLRYEDLAFRSGISPRKIKRYLSTAARTIPPRDIVVLLSLAMQVPFEYFRELLQKGKYSVDRAETTPRDWLIMEMYRKGKTRTEIDAELYRLGHPILRQK